VSIRSGHSSENRERAWHCIGNRSDVNTESVGTGAAADADSGYDFARIQRRSLSAARLYLCQRIRCFASLLRNTCAFFEGLVRLSISPSLEGFLHYTSYKDTAPSIFSSHASTLLAACDLAYGFASCLITAGVNLLSFLKDCAANPTRP
jgi:hypothetical protein